MSRLEQGLPVMRRQEPTHPAACWAFGASHLRGDGGNDGLKPTLLSLTRPLCARTGPDE